MPFDFKLPFARQNSPSDSFSNASLVKSSQCQEQQCAVSVCAIATALRHQLNTLHSEASAAARGRSLAARCALLCNYPNRVTWRQRPHTRCRWQLARQPSTTGAANCGGSSCIIRHLKLEADLNSMSPRLFRQKRSLQPKRREAGRRAPDLNCRA